MTLSQLSVQYDASSALVAGRLAQLRLALRTTGDQEEARRLRRRIAELRPMLEQCRRLTQLTPRQREVLALYMERDMNVTQIAAVLGVNKSTVSRSLHRALRRLERCLRYSF